MTETQNRPVGCILIDDPVSGEDLLSGLSLPDGLLAHPVQWRTGEKPLEALQALLQRVRKACGAAGVLALGAGCMAALALAEQLPVERLALVEPMFEPAGLTFTRRRFTGFAMRNLALCVSDALIVGSGDSRVARQIARGLRANGRVTRVSLPGGNGQDLYTICENDAQRAVFAFLLGEELPKDLAQTSEMLYNH